MLSFGNTGYNTALRVGASHAGKAFLGGVQVWPCITEPPPPGPDVSRIRWDGITGWSSTPLPKHDPGDLIVLVMPGTQQALAFKPDPGGDVPDWIIVGEFYEGGFAACTVAYFTATTSTHVSGEWVDGGYGYVLNCPGSIGIGDIQGQCVDQYSRNASMPVIAPGLSLQGSQSETVHYGIGLCDDQTGAGGTNIGQWIAGSYPPPGYVEHNYDTVDNGYSQDFTALISKPNASTAEPVTIGEVVAGDSITTGTVGSIEVLY